MCIPLVAFAMTGCLDTTLEKSYSTMATAVADGAVTRGWIPEWVPANATDLDEVHDLDSNESALSFNVPANSELALPVQCKLIKASGTLPVRFDRRWWPTGAELAKSYTFHSCPTGLVATHESGHRVLHWRTNGR
jgi:hypothetical protein